MRIKHVAALPFAVMLAACTTATTTPPAVSPIASTSVPDSDGIVSRFDNDIWPAIAAYNADASQNGPADAKLAKVIDPTASPGRAQLRDAVHSLGENSHDNTMEGRPTRDPWKGLQLGSSLLTAVNSPDAVLQVCYTYTLTNAQPGTSEATIELHKSDVWYLHAVTNDHVVPGCQNSKA
ncbi:MAG: hypothetical protein ACRDTI_04320 [Mycobacterium sp.]